MNEGLWVSHWVQVSKLNADKMRRSFKGEWQKKLQKSVEDEKALMCWKLIYNFLGNIFFVYYFGIKAIIDKA